MEPHLTRRRVLELFGGAAVFAVAGCGSSGSETSTKESSTSASSAGGTAPAQSAAPAASTAPSAPLACKPIPTETVGPYPGDGSNGPNALTQQGIVRRDIRHSFGAASRQTSGVPLTIELTVVDAKNGCKPLAGAAVYAWHCDANGLYSMYSSGVTNENFMRGVQEADGEGKLSFITNFPGAYQGRYPHVHFEVFGALGRATSGANKLVVSQLALPAEICQAVYATKGYEASARNFPLTPVNRDNVFSDGVDQQMAATAGAATSGYTARLTIAV